MMDNILSDKEADVLRMRYGFERDYDMTLEEIGEEFGVTAQRIYQIEKKALEKLRKSPRARKLRDYWEG